HADPAADWVLALTALDATTILQGPNGDRRITVENFLIGPYATALGHGEILVAVEVARPRPQARWGYWKFVRQAGDFAKASAAIFLDPERNLRRCVVGALGGPPLVLVGFDEYLVREMTAIDLLHGALPDRELGSLALHAAALDRAREAVT
ncbi:MAG: carbon monoxide dehydrogenase, partial [Rhodospirillaceae bacterium]|nr:carbon monoxide dehydrogenase [Rhodospirillaceae bacterium]